MNGVPENLMYKPVEKTPTSFTKTRKAIGGLALSLALLGGGAISSNRPVEAQATTETPAGDVSDSEYAPDCGYGGYPIWRADDNADGQPGPDRGEFVCLNLPGCFTRPVLPFPILEALSRQGLLTSSQYAAISPRQNAKTVQCNGVPAITGLGDYEYLLDNDPEILDYIRDILSNELFWGSAEVQAQLERFETTWADDWWWNKVRVANTPETTPDTTEQAPVTGDKPEETPTTTEPPQTTTPEATPDATEQAPVTGDKPEETPTTTEPPQTTTPEATPDATEQAPVTGDKPEETPTTTEPPQTTTPEATPDTTEQAPVTGDTPEETPTTTEPPQTTTPETTPDTTDQTQEDNQTGLIALSIGVLATGLGLAWLGVRARRIRRAN